MSGSVAVAEGVAAGVGLRVEAGVGAGSDAPPQAVATIVSIANISTNALRLRWGNERGGGTNRPEGMPRFAGERRPLAWE